MEDTLCMKSLLCDSSFYNLTLGALGRELSENIACAKIVLHHL